jgi:hypothetical protein
MIIYCPRCRLPLTVERPTGRPVTCPSCLERITLSPPALPTPVLPLDYHATTGDLEAELQKDLQFVVWGIAAFGVMALIGFFALRNVIGGAGPQKIWLGWIAIVTTIVAAVSLGRHYYRRKRVERGELVRLRTGGQRVASVIVLGIGGLLLMGITVLAALVLLLVACFAIASMR